MNPDPNNKTKKTITSSFHPQRYQVSETSADETAEARKFALSTDRRHRRHGSNSQEKTASSSAHTSSDPFSRKESSSSRTSASSSSSSPGPQEHDLKQERNASKHQPEDGAKAPQNPLNDNANQSQTPPSSEDGLLLRQWKWASLLGSRPMLDDASGMTRWLQQVVAISDQRTPMAIAPEELVDDLQISDISDPSDMSSEDDDSSISTVEDAPSSVTPPTLEYSASSREDIPRRIEEEEDEDVAYIRKSSFDENAKPSRFPEEAFAAKRNKEVDISNIITVLRP
eukprot:CAMPEP_0176111900 /NCGR_PEP_ID=MMETSP0120_2-20121206/56194_1 /TAXON_ID=160619 /ORGANISM="Kryptoperidinium foliaceum, Strain CCMP 1326" /LENGTH=283 /DNA_ID=CAMNT_0017446121 /DNA_START=256 /DNA_END=1108 /DNA_ORIENTATION=-